MELNKALEEAKFGRKAVKTGQVRAELANRGFLVHFRSTESTTNKS